MDEVKEIHEHFRESGIGARFFSHSLTNYGEVGNNFAHKVKDTEWLSGVVSGCGVNFYGKGSYELSVMVAKGLVLRQLTVQVITLAGLMRVMQTDFDFAKQLTSQDVLVLTRFCAGKDFPLTAYQRLQVEDLLRDRWDEALPVFIQTEKRLETYKDWWAEDIVDCLVTNNETIEVK